MRAAGVGAVVTQHADVAANDRAHRIGAFERPAPAALKELRFVAHRPGRFGAVAFGPAASFGKAVLEQAGMPAQRSIDGDGDLDGLGADRDLRLGFGVRCSDVCNDEQ